LYKRKGLEVVPENSLFPISSRNPYTADFDEENEQEDIITVRITPPKEHYYHDENGVEKIELRELDPEANRFTEEDSPQEVFRQEELLTEEAILDEAKRYKPEVPLDPDP
jgi:hypothetical protein